MPDPAPITALLTAWRSGDEAALTALSPLVYDELKRLALSAFRQERPGHTLQPTALVHEAFIRLVDADVNWESRAHFYALSARMMRRILVNHAEARGARKRGGQQAPIPLDEELVPAPPTDDRLLDLDDALRTLAEFDERKAQLVELQLFGGLSFDEMAEVSGLSSSTLDRELRAAKAWLKQRISID